MSVFRLFLLLFYGYRSVRGSLESLSRLECRISPLIPR